MPILAREPDLHPVGLLQDSSQACPSRQSTWWVLYTLSRREKELMRRLCRWDIAFYCPLVRRLTRSAAGRKQVAHVPLFSSYVFLYGNELDRHRAMASNCVSRWLAVPDATELTHDLRQIYRLLETGARVTPEAHLVPGMRVRIRTGPLKGMEGVVIKRLHQWRLVLSVNFLQQGASLQLEDWQVERLD
jgi:transcriptional antiterminator RfaH